MDFAALAQQCAPQVEVSTLQALARTESAFNPFAIGVVGGALSRQPRSLAEAQSTLQLLDAKGYDYSVGILQVNKRNWKRYGLDAQNAFEVCRNLAAGAAILHGCYQSARVGMRGSHPQRALRAAFSCYNTGNFRAGYGNGYVGQVVRNAGVQGQ